MIHERFEKARRRGLESERNVQIALQGLPNIRLEKHAQFSKKDREGIDFTAHFQTNTPNVTSVDIQVKSSDHEIEKLKQSLMEEHNLPSDEEYHEWLLRNRFVILKGTKDYWKLRDVFMEQVNAIDQYHKKTGLK